MWPTPSDQEEQNNEKSQGRESPGTFIARMAPSFFIPGGYSFTPRNLTEDGTFPFFGRGIGQIQRASIFRIFFATILPFSLALCALFSSHVPLSSSSSTNYSFANI
ncbi:hypothetical protein AVEN_26304-1 [Araneus ventricosus]|uniref:Uncharacterized protein n=1 Tax=Araneus ventricosus TaxID=182803 RepID=A0A4Y2AN04_ARAVE|nr:hypothetical protein AVEN_26304-1 [Araneus ventricosus]